MAYVILDELDLAALKPASLEDVLTEVKASL